MNITSLLESGIVVPSLESPTAEEAIRELVEALIGIGRFAPERRESTLVALFKREAAATTGLGQGFAMPHAKLSNLEDFVVGVGISRRGIDFRAADRRTVGVVFLLLSPEDDPYGHLNLMGRIAALVRLEGFVDSVGRCRTVESCLECFGDEERRLFP